MSSHKIVTKAHIPVIDTQLSVIFPNSQVVLYIKEPKDRNGLQFAVEHGHQVLLLSTDPTANSEIDNAQNQLMSRLLPVGILAEVKQLKKSLDGSFQAILSTIGRIKIIDLLETDGFIQGTYENYDTNIDIDEKTENVLLENLKKSANSFVKLVENLDVNPIKKLIDSANSLEFMVYLTVSHLALPFDRKRYFLEERSLKQLGLNALQDLVQEKERISFQIEIGEKVSNKMSKQQRESMLRSQLQALRIELDELTGEKTEETDYEGKIAASAMPDAVRKVARDEAKKLKEIQERSADYGVIKNYLDTLLRLPWHDSPKVSIDLDRARRVLASEHYGLEEVKKRVTQHLGVMKLKRGRQGSVILLVGPPGVGKTSISKSIANALGRPFVRASLGGVRDEAEIRGHRRTYVGAMPGKIIQALKEQKQRNPVFLLDEIDKLAIGYGGDPSAALLEVLDSNQNDTFRDHFLDVPFDLSDVLFVATANSVDTIPKPLLDRMEIIKVESYTTTEKLHIAQNHLLPKQLEDHGIKSSQLDISAHAMSEIITAHTREAGVRELNRKIATICRGSVEQILSAPEKLVMVNCGDLKGLLGAPRFRAEIISNNVSSGVVTGLAWTPVGGDILFIEARKMPGNGRLLLTGHLGEVMRESAQIALTQVRSHLSRPDKPLFDFDKIDIHVHVPQGSIPKDGPSAGATMLTTLASLMIDRPVDGTLAMTGELTLRGAITAVGGIKEKLIAAHRAGVKKVLIPKGNEVDLDVIADEVRSGLEIVLVSTAAEVLWHALAVEKWEKGPWLANSTAKSGVEVINGNPG